MHIKDPEKTVPAWNSDYGVERGCVKERKKLLRNP
jgi:hypothetical protein